MKAVSSKCWVNLRSRLRTLDCFPIFAKVRTWYINIRVGIFYMYYFMGAQWLSILHRKLRALTAPSSLSYLCHFLLRFSLFLFLFLFLLTLPDYSLRSSSSEGFESILRPEIRLLEWRIGYSNDLS
jgi:hypothetical protein